MKRAHGYRIAGLMSLLFSTMLVAAFAAGGEEQKKPGQEPEPELTIVHYGSLLVKSSIPNARVLVDDVYKGRSDSIIESLVVGEHMISCRAEEGEDQAVWGSFHIRKNETLRLEASFDEGKLTVLREAAKAEPEKKKPEPVKQEKPKKQVAETKRNDQKNPIEERRKQHLNVMRLEFDVTDSQDIRIDHEGGARVISKYAEKKNRTGKYYRTKQGVLLCDIGPCELTWTATFLYTDETGKADALLLNWKEIVFNGITPAGTSKRELECCLNGQCWKMQDNSATDTSQEYQVGRYSLSWTKSRIVIRRSDIMKEITDAGRSLADY